MRPKPTVGQTVYWHNGARLSTDLKPMIIRKVGRKYLTAFPERYAHVSDSGAFETRFRLTDWMRDDYTGCRLFLSADDMRETLTAEGMAVKQATKRHQLFTDIASKLQYLNGLSLDQLRRIKAIIDEGGARE